ncbi:hydroxymethylglutaryl-CoA reductase, degradative [Latilactobacillus graminis]|uniref:3-hydroxy-3-methylglutaryl coenzyme A reductase n=2 Tax=Latilactobacillus graminis TaxID=60519 RepID=A0AA89L3E5_9LACO|nr:hydroxymethylglutaryl-CoA reductase, degradative [Latilactobacillus graminis]KRM21045.1 hydroxymethylglutaryl-CoA reductase, degradative [Latilactobacillus graminis DSM 20719]QFP79179.1 hydroxymethylglutaryl-CoA reductase, degradative [Latilactobacillus graminis]
MEKPKFYQLTKNERLATLVEQGILNQTDAEFLAAAQPLSDELAGNMIENQIGQYQIPLGVVQDLLVNQTLYQVPFAIEEPSVVAAANNAAKIGRINGGFVTESSTRKMTGEVVLVDLGDLKVAQDWVSCNNDLLFEVAQAAHPSIMKHGGGLRAITVAIIDQRFLKLTLQIDTQEAMGANIVNTICEAIAHAVQQQLGGTILLSVLTNAAFEAVVSASVTINPATLATSTLSGEVIATKIIAATDFAKVDVARAATHNKGIMNGIDAVIMATGNDWRAIEAGAHSYAARDGAYQPLTSWQWTAQRQLQGRIELPLPVGMVGGSIGILPTVQINQRLLNVQSARELAGIIAAIGLAQNLAALKALVSDGIQKGHMALQAKSLAIAAGANDRELTQLLPLLLTAPHLNTAIATALLAQLRAENK